MSEASFMTTPLAKSPGHVLSNKDANNLDEFQQDPDNSLLLEERDLSSATSRIAPDEPANNARKQNNKKRPKTTKHARKLAVATTLGFSRLDPKP